MFKNILLPVDIDDKNSWKIAFPAAIKLMNFAPTAVLNIITVIPTPAIGMLEEYFPKGWIREATKRSKEKLEEIAQKHLPEGLKYNLIVERGVVYQAVIEKSEELEVDLIIMTAYNQNKRDYLLGPNVAKVVRHANTSVLVVRDND